MNEAVHDTLNLLRQLSDLLAEFPNDDLLGRALARLGIVGIAQQNVVANIRHLRNEELHRFRQAVPPPQQAEEAEEEADVAENVVEQNRLGPIRRGQFLGPRRRLLFQPNQRLCRVGEHRDGIAPNLLRHQAFVPQVAPLAGPQPFVPPPPPPLPEPAAAAERNAENASPSEEEGPIGPIEPPRITMEVEPVNVTFGLTEELDDSCSTAILNTTMEIEESRNLDII
ncbi:uncharacterized protein CELE_Y105E8A.28 [Caenorhabditis elegans]|uniref:Uncharacterized protein n=1 Tax=Caenorhabditis elegans TaxID=6239 RepID=Q7YTU2_CAEEL|nr:Uncharacterized protein CELE_Y105E8A.28 [Caenorhabditis elegans]CAD92403.4 Uncharacterized protein CELE_Y105E8A.28 [Caenorhabditis elegans]